MKPQNNLCFSILYILLLFILGGCFDGSSSSEKGATPPVVVQPPLTGSEDCNGDDGGTAYLDNCGFCVGGNTGDKPCFLDCNGDANGTAYIDDCGVCVEGNTGQVACATTPTYPTNAEILSQCINNIYYLDQNNGLDTNSGSQVAPWETLAKSKTVASSGDCVIIKSGNYGSYEENNIVGRTDYITYIADENSTVTFKSISLQTTSYLTFYGMAIKPDLVDPASSGNIGADDPLYPESTQGTYAKSPSPVYLDDVQYFKLIDCQLTGPNKYLTLSGITALNSQDILINHCEIKRVNRGVNFSSTSNIEISYNQIYEITASAIVQGNVNCPNTLILGNHAYDSNYAVSDNYCPRALNANYHGSGIAIRSGDTTIQGNILHNGFPSAGIMTYDADVGGIPHFDNVTIENNVLYDLNSVYVLRIYLMGDNFIVRNNTLVGIQRVPNNDGRYEYSTAFIIHSLDSDGAPYIEVHNNAFVGIFNIGVGLGNYTEDNNFMWSWSYGATFYCEGGANVGPNSKVATCSYGYKPVSVVTALFANTITMAPNHNLFLSFRQDLNSDLVNLGDPGVQQTTSLGSIDGQGFIRDNGPLRSNTSHSAGAYELY